MANVLVEFIKSYQIIRYYLHSFNREDVVVRHFN